MMKNIDEKQCIVSEKTGSAYIIPSDFPDPDVIRVDDTYYLVSTTMHMTPGAVILRSYNLLDWEFCSYVFDELDGTDGQKLSDNKGIYGRGMWAACIRYHADKFWVSFVANDTRKSYLYTADEITGPWKRQPIEGFYHDMSVLFDDDGRAWITSGNREIYLTEMKADLSGPVPGGFNDVIVREPEGHEGLGHEGSHLYKIYGRYYLFTIDWPRGKPRTENCFVADKITGPWKGGPVLSSEFDGWHSGAAGDSLLARAPAHARLHDRCNNSNRPAKAGAAQGGIVDTPDGRWYAIVFQDHGALGRTPVLVSVRFEDGWPVFGEAAATDEADAPDKAPAADKAAGAYEAAVADKAPAADKAPVADKAAGADEADAPDKAPAADKAAGAYEAAVADKADVPDKAATADKAAGADEADASDKAPAPDKAAGADKATAPDRAAGADKATAAFKTCGGLKVWTPGRTPAPLVSVPDLRPGYQYAPLYGNTFTIAAPAEKATAPDKIAVPDKAAGADKATAAFKTCGGPKVWTPGRTPAPLVTVPDLRPGYQYAPLYGNTFTIAAPAEKATAPDKAAAADKADAADKAAAAEKAVAAGKAAATDKTCRPLAPYWQWNHIHDPRLVTLTERTLSITTDKLVKNPVQAANTLTQRTWGLECAADVTLSAAGLNDGDVAGLMALEGEYAFIGIMKQYGKYKLVTARHQIPYEGWAMGVHDDELPTFITQKPLSGPEADLRLKFCLDEEDAHVRMLFREQAAAADKAPAADKAAPSDKAPAADKAAWRQLGKPAPLRFTLDQFVGVRSALFCYSTEKTGGTAQFSNFSMQIIRSF